LRFSRNEQVSKFGFSVVSCDFQGTQKILEMRIFPQFLGILKDRLVKKLELGLLRSFLRILKGWTQVLPEYPEGEVGQEEGGAVPLG
jgi:hypothetical protein